VFVHTFICQLYVIIVAVIFSFHRINIHYTLDYIADICVWPLKLIHLVFIYDIFIVFFSFKTAWSTYVYFFMYMC